MKQAHFTNAPLAAIELVLIVENLGPALARLTDELKGNSEFHLLSDPVRCSITDFYPGVITSFSMSRNIFSVGPTWISIHSENIDDWKTSGQSERFLGSVNYFLSTLKDDFIEAKYSLLHTALNIFTDEHKQGLNPQQFFSDKLMLAGWGNSVCKTLFDETPIMAETVLVDSKFLLSIITSIRDDNPVLDLRIGTAPWIKFNLNEIFLEAKSMHENLNRCFFKITENIYDSLRNSKGEFK